MVRAPVSGQLLGDRFFTLAATRIPPLRQPDGVPLAGHNRSQNRHTGSAVQIRDRAMQPHVHLIQALLHAPQPIGALGYQHRFAAHQRTQVADGILRPETTPQQAATVQKLNPLAIQHIRFASRHPAQVARIDQQHFDTAALQQFKQRNPIHPGTLHRHRFHSQLQQPVGQGQQLGRSGPELAYFRAATLGRRRTHIVALASYIDAPHQGTDLW
jgi:hypothetical protein